MNHRKPIFLIIAFLSFVFAQAQNEKTIADYNRAASMMGGGVSKLIDFQSMHQWLPDGTLLYRSFEGTASKYALFNPVDKSTKTAATRKELTGDTKSGPQQQRRRGGLHYISSTSPDGKYNAFIKNWNLWVKNNESGKEVQLTTDGVQDFGYATDNAGWTHSDRPIVAWSPDSKKISTFQQDQRHVKEMYLVKTKVGSPELEAWKYPLPGDSAIVKIHRVIIDVTDEANPKMVRLKMGADEHRGTLSDDISSAGGFDDNSWAADSKTLAFVSTSRDHKQENLRIANAETGDVRDVLEEKVATQYESGQGEINWKYLSATNEIIWYSERTDWAHLYMYDAATGKLKNAITSGNFVVTRILNIDEPSKTIYFEAKGREPGRNPYFTHVYSVNFSGKNLKLLTPGDGNHSVSFSPDMKYLLDTYSQPNVPPVFEVRTIAGKLVSELGRTNISRLTATGWKAPTPFTVKSADGKWDLYGIYFTPTNFDANKKYPVVVYIYPGPQGGSMGSWSFSASRGDNQALAELGFVVVALEGSCNPNRSKSFHDACYGNMASNTLADQVEGLKQLQSKLGFLDLDRVGIWGHSGGGFATAAAMFRYPDFFKVGISESGNHDNRNYEDDWWERYNGFTEKNAAGNKNYEEQANQTVAKNLKGKLLLVHGGMDDNVPPYNAYLVADALVKANKDFDLLILPNARHGYGQDNNYVMRRRWDYFVQYLQNAKPPKEYKIKSEPDPRMN